MRPSFSALAASMLLLGCVSGSKLIAESEVIRADIDRARQNGAMRCAPRELASAEANLEFALGELGQGSSYRASQHIREADGASKQALNLSRNCGPKRVLVRETPEEKPQPMIVRIDSADSDNDGVPDSSDACPQQAEDKDGFQDEDGCPDVDNDNDGLLDSADQCPTEAGPVQNVGCPVKDKDGDGILDTADKCPNEAEDKDGFQDDDGCPDLDNDGDGIPDGSDACPLEPGVAEEKGCPRKYSMVVVKQDRIEIKKQIKFKTNSAKIVGTESFTILSEVAQALRDVPRIKKLRVEGHTDSVGSDAKNLKLSQGRADSVMAALIKEGVDPGRLEAVGYGEAKPIASNATAAGRAENRRTEFNIVEQ